MLLSAKQYFSKHTKDQTELKNFWHSGQGWMLSLVETIPSIFAPSGRGLNLSFQNKLTASANAIFVDTTAFETTTTSGRPFCFVETTAIGTTNGSREAEFQHIPD